MAPRGFGSFIAMPLIGLLTSKVDPRKLVAGGLALGGWTLIWLGQINLQAGYWDFFWPQVLQGFALGMLFVPLTTVTMGDLAREEIGNASTLFNLVRNVGGSVGIALISTMLTRVRIAHHDTLASHVTMYDAGVQAMYRQFLQLFQARGAFAPELAAAAAINGLVQRQASLLAFIDMFRLLGIVFIVLIPVVFLMRRPRGGQVVAAAAE